MARSRRPRATQPEPIQPTAIYTRKELPRLLRIGRDAVAEEIAQKKLRFVTKGNRQLFYGAWLMDWVNALEGVPGPVKPRER